MNRCWCGARVLNSHHCENGHLQHRFAWLALLCALTLGACASSHEPPATCPPKPTAPQCMAVIAHCPDLQLACEQKLPGACANAKTICELEAACECE